MRKYLFLIIALSFFSLPSHAQFKKLLKKAEHKAMEKVLGTSDSGSTPSEAQPDDAQPEPPDAQSSPTDHQDNHTKDQKPKIKPIDFPVTGEEVHATHCVYEWVVDTAKFVKKMSQTEEGAYAFDLARKKGLKGSDEEIFQQLMRPENKELRKEISKEVREKFPNQEETPKGYKRKKWSNSEWSGEVMIPSENPDPSNNPAWGGVSMPSVFFSTWGGDFSTWMTDRYIKSKILTMHNGRPTIFGAFGLRAASIINLKTNTIYAIGAVLGIQFTKVSHWNLENKDSARLRILHTMGMVQKFWPVPGIKSKPGPTGKFGSYHTVSEKMIIPVRPFTDPETGKESDILLKYHDALSGKEDAKPHHNHYDSSYKIIYVFYFTHDLDNKLPAGILEKYKEAGLAGKGFCVGSKIEDENGNSAVYRLTKIQTDVAIDKGQFQIPEDYPVMTQDEINKAVKKQFSLKSLFKKAVKGGHNNEKN